MPKLDSPWRRMAWVLPASLCVWVAALAGFSMLIGKIVQPPKPVPLEVSLADIPPGVAGGAPGGDHSRPQDTGASGPPTPQHAASAKKAPPIQPHARPTSGRPVVHIAHKAKPVATHEKRHHEASTSLRARTAKARPIAPPYPIHKDNPAETTPPSHPRKEAAVPARIAPKPATPATVGRVSGSSIPAVAGTGGIGAGRGSNAAGGQGHGTGGVIGNGSHPYTSVAHPPVSVYRVLPEYPRMARLRGLEGEVVLRAVIDRHGAVEHGVEVVESVPMLDRAAIEALRQWRFEPGRDAQDHPVPVVIQVPLRFQLR